MDQVITDVVWYGDRQNEEYSVWWDMALLKDAFNGVLWKGTRSFRNYNGIDSLPQESKGAVVVVPSRLWVGSEHIINVTLQRLGFVVLILCGNEEGTFDISKIKHPMLRAWMQLPRMNKHNDVSYKLVNGYRTTTKQLIKEAGSQERTIDWAFMGQVNHERRQQCVDVLRQFKPLYPTAVLVETDAFGKEVIPYDKYISALARTKIVPCPSGVESPDSFRLYEALEAGCLPVVDAFSTNNKAPGFWQYLLGESPPFPVIDYWDKFPIILPQLLREYPSNVNRVQSWWALKKRELYFKLIEDIEVLRG